MTTTTELKKLLFSMILKTPIWLVHLAANESSVNEHTYNELNGLEAFHLKLLKHMVPICPMGTCCVYHNLPLRSEVYCTFGIKFGTKFSNIFHICRGHAILAGPQ